MSKTKFKTLQFVIPGDNSITYALALEDEFSEYGLIIGGPSEVKRAIDSLSVLLKSGQADEKTDHLDERLGTHWLSVSEAAQEYDIAISTVRYAAQSGHIHRAEKQNGQWRFPARTFRYWLQNRPRPGPKTAPTGGRPRKEQP